MASKQIAARMSGDDYQARFFWYMASQLLFVDSNVARVSIEYDEATHVDDVAVFYKPPDKSDLGIQSEADFFQVKFHVDQRNSYTADNMIDPSFINSPSKSLLQHFFEAYNDLRGAYSLFTLNLVSNWIWRGDDNLATSIRDGGTLPDKFFTASERTNFGQIRKRWTEHLHTDDETFQDFGQRLQFNLNYFGNGALNSALSDRLIRAGLRPLDPCSIISPYDDVARKFIQKGRTVFDKDSLLTECRRERLVQSDPIPLSEKTIGIRSFVRFAENIGIETDGFVCVSDQFDGRHARYDSSWMQAAASIKKFIESNLQELGRVEHKILLDCHSSLALFAGYLITSRAPVYPAGPRPKQELYKPTTQKSVPESDLWKVRFIPVKDGAPYLAVVISVTHQADRQVLEYIDQGRDDVSNLLILEPPAGTGPSSVIDANQALAMSHSLMQIVRRYQNNHQRTLLFISAPNFLSYFIGQQCPALGNLTLFEYDFDGPQQRTYRESITIPLPRA
jgi:hypothetical protein